MRVIDPGHCYFLDCLDGAAPHALVFVKRVGAKYPGNVSPAHGGTTLQEVLRALIERCDYVQRQTPCPETEAVAGLLRTAVWLLESRAARVHGRPMTATIGQAVSGADKCGRCGHVGCPGCIGKGD